MQNANKNSFWVFGTLALATLVVLEACDSTVVGGGTGGSGGRATTSATSGNGGSGGAGNGGSGTAGGNPGSSNAIAMLYSELQAPDPTGTGNTTAASGSGGGPDGNTLYLAISDTPESCPEPYAVEPCGNHYRISIGIPVDLQKVGIIPLNDTSIISNYSWSGLEDGGGLCPGGGGSFWDGELEITAIDDTHVAGILTNTSTFDFDANGAFDAPRCVF